MEEKMKERYKIIYQGGEGEIVEKKSRFIAEIRPVESEEDKLDPNDLIKEVHAEVCILFHD